MRIIRLAAVALLALALPSSVAQAADPAADRDSTVARDGASGAADKAPQAVSSDAAAPAGAAGKMPDKAAGPEAGRPAPIYVGAYSVDHEFNIVTAECLEILRTKRILIGSRSWGLGLGKNMEMVDKKYAINWEAVAPQERIAPDKMVLPANLFDKPKVAQYTFYAGPARYLLMDDFLRKDPWKFGGKIDGCLQLIYTAGDKNIAEKYFPVFDQWMKDFPKVKFAISTHHVNASGKKSDGKEEPEDTAWNVYGQEYSDAVIRKYYGKAPIFDIRDIASTKPDGTVCTFQYEGKTYRKMWREYNVSGDLIHMNSAEARQRMGKGLLILLTKMFCGDKIPKDLNTPKPAILQYKP